MDLMDRQSERCTALLVKNEGTTDDDINMERGTSEGDRNQILHIDVKEEYSPYDLSWQEEDPLALSPQNECMPELDEDVELQSVQREVVEQTILQQNSGIVEDLAMCQPTMTTSFDIQESFLSTKYILHKSFVERSCNKTVGGKTTQCSCSNVCTCQQAESLHCYIATKNRHYSCSNIVLSDKTSLTTECTQHIVEKPFQCSTCSKAFRHKSHLISHCRTHTGEKPYQCSTCGKAFSERSTLIGHCRQHTGEKPYQCSTCGSAFSSKSTLIVHCRQHTGEKPFKCSTCSKSFGHKSHLISHCRIHTGEKPYQCSSCGKAFSHKSDLIKHSRQHTGEKPYQCTTCGNAFSRYSTLIVHCRQHMTEQPYQCSTCGNAFSCKSRLISHCRKHTSE